MSDEPRSKYFVPRKLNLDVTVVGAPGSGKSILNQLLGEVLESQGISYSLETEGIVTIASPEPEVRIREFTNGPWKNANVPQLYAALTQLLNEVVEAGFDTARDYNWPRSIADARAALNKAKE